jgi:hypothetical protein
MCGGCWVELILFDLIENLSKFHTNGIYSQAQRLSAVATRSGTVFTVSPTIIELEISRCIAQEAVAMVVVLGGVDPILSMGGISDFLQRKLV